MPGPPCVDRKRRLMRSSAQKNYADMDPIEELRAIREELSREFPTGKALGDYLRAKYPETDPTRKSQPKSQRSPAKPKPRANARPAMRQRKTTVHA